jgi:hypothetical protein
MLKAPPRSKTRVMNVAFNMPGASRGRSRLFSNFTLPSASSLPSKTVIGAPLKVRAGSSNT